jgi:DNA primase
MTAWIDFKKLRTDLNFGEVLRVYGVNLNPKGAQHQGRCPLPAHKCKNTSTCFSANLERGIFQCFACGAKGNTLDFAVLMEQLNPGDGADVRKAALNLQAKFKTKEAVKPAKPKQEELLAREQMADRSVEINAPLDFELKQLDPKHPYLEWQGFTERTIRHFGIGFCSKGYLAGRIAIPIHEHLEGKLVGYVGMSIEHGTSPDNPRFKFPSKRERKGVVHEFYPGLLLYNAHQVRGPVNDLVVAGDYESVWWLFQMGYPQAVCPLNPTLTEQQMDTITDLLSPCGTAWILCEGSTAGAEMAKHLLSALSPLRFTRWVKLDDGKHPTGYPGAYYREKLGK